MKNKTHTLAELMRMNAFPWIKHRTAYVNLIMSDKMNGNLLDVRIEGSGTQRRYFIEDKNLKRFLKKNTL